MTAWVLWNPALSSQALPLPGRTATSLGPRKLHRRCKIKVLEKCGVALLPQGASCLSHRPVLPKFPFPKVGMKQELPLAQAVPRS